METLISWREQVLSTYTLRKPIGLDGQPEETVVTGEGGGFLVYIEELDRKAYLKPTKSDEAARAAREKIASDLAADLGVNAPPVLLAERDDHGNDERFVCISLVMFPRQFSSGHIEHALSRRGSRLDRIRPSLPRAASAAFAFDMWVMQPDHASPHNIIFGFDPKRLDEGQLIFLDYSLAFGQWGEWGGRPGRRRFFKHLPFPGYLRNAVQPELLLEAVEQIENYNDSSIDEIIDRVPRTYLKTDDADNIRNGLRYRRSQLRKCLASFLE